MTLDELTTDFIRIHSLFEEHKATKDAKNYWEKAYQTERVHRDTICVHCVDAFAYDVANRRLEQYYNSKYGVKNEK